jgi:hypothetical protein
VRGSSHFRRVARPEPSAIIGGKQLRGGVALFCSVAFIFDPPLFRALILAIFNSNSV